MPDKNVNGCYSIIELSLEYTSDDTMETMAEDNKNQILAMKLMVYMICVLVSQMERMDQNVFLNHMELDVVL